MNTMTFNFSNIFHSKKKEIRKAHFDELEKQIQKNRKEKHESMKKVSEKSIALQKTIKQNHFSIQIFRAVGGKDSK